VRRVTAAWVGNVSAGLAHAYRRAMEQGIPRRIEVRDHSNFTLAQALLAGALGAPYLPTRTLLGSDIPRANGTFIASTSPIDGSPLLLIPAITPDVTVLAVQRADADGNAHLWGPWGVSQEAALAAKAVIVLADEVVARDVIASDPNRTVVPALKVVAYGLKGLDAQQFADLAREAEGRCPVSNAYRGTMQITVEAHVA